LRLLFYLNTQHNNTELLGQQKGLRACPALCSQRHLGKSKYSTYDKIYQNLVKKSSDNIQRCIDGENYGIEEMYPAFNAVAKLQGESRVERSTLNALEAEKVHSAMYQKAKQAVDSGKDAEVGEVYICQVCGYTVEGDAPDRCPICGAPKERFKKF